MPLALFDLDNTLISRQQLLAPIAEQFCAAHGVDADAAPRVADTFLERTGPEVFARLRSEYGLPEQVTHLWAWYVDAIAAAVDCPVPVLDGLQQLRDCGWTVAVVTNGATDIQTAKLSATGLDQIVDAAVISESVGIRKPDPAIFRAAAARCGKPLAGGWMTGDNPDTDISGAHGVGLRAIWIAAGRTWTHDAPPAEHTADDALAAITHLLTL
ncbi:HAD family hydrolase [Streptacidiphilus sp. N1-12]|uniref:HAD family hydrolase n=1 Tax=Streptacidiphilus alkalitolerans TaxID=3342712 RepID=A0ABV6WRC2_9ACTN